MHNIHDEFKWIPRKKRWRINNKQHIATNTMPIEESDTFIEHCYSSAIAKGQRSTYPSRRWPSFETCTRGSRRGRKSQKKKPLILSATNGRHIALVDYRQLAIQISLLFILFITISATTESGRWQGTRRRHRVHVCGFNMQAMGSIVAPPLSNLKAVASSAVIGQEGQEEKRGKKKTRPAFFYPPETRMAAHKRNSDENKSEE